MDNPLNILHLLSYHLYTGPVEPVLRLAQTQTEMGHSVKLAIDTVRDGDIAKQAESYGVPIDTRFALSAKSNPLNLAFDLVALRRIWIRSQVDIIHAHRSHDHTLAALTRHRKSKTILVRTLHTERALGRDRSWQLKRVDGIVTVARKFRNLLIKRGLLAPDRVISVEGCVDAARYCPGRDAESLRRQYGIPAHVPVAGIVARMKPNRGHHLLLQAWGLVTKRLPEALLLIAGRGELESQLRRAVTQKPWAERVIFLGYRRDLLPVYRAFDLKIILAPGNDGTCRAALEAMATGVCVLASHQGALSEIVTDGKTGKLINRMDPRVLADALVEMLSDRHRLNTMGLQARQEALVRFDRWKQAHAVEKLYRRIINWHEPEPK